MSDVWFKRCPQCGTYMKKLELQDAAICGDCGWEEIAGAFYCDVIDSYCMHFARNNRDSLELPPFDRRR